MKMLLTGGSGALGSRIARLATESGIEVRVMSRRSRPADVQWYWTQADLVSGEGVSGALSAIDVVVHAASDPRQQQAVDVEGTRRLITSARHAHVQHFIYVSIVGIDQIPYSYYRRKLEAERSVQSSGIPFTIIRSTQFHSFVDAILTLLARTPLILPIPKGFVVQSVDVREVAARIIRAVVAGPSNDTINFGGPEVLRLDRMAAQWLSARQFRKHLIGVPIPGALGRAIVTAKNTAPEGERGALRWQDWLAQEHPRHYTV